MLVYREGRRAVSGPALVSRLRGACCNQSSLITALLLAGELECGIADAAGDASRSTACAQGITDLIARCHMSDETREIRVALSLIDQLDVPCELRVSLPEGFAYYGLHPQGYAELARGLVVKEAAVIGIRSIGTTLSAVVCEALRARGIRAKRITVRPHGHPFGRQTEFSAPKLEWLQNFSPQTQFLIVDEGPGLSGSSFLSVADALLREGVGAERVHFLCGHAADMSRLCAPNAATRWAKFKCHPATSSDKPAGADIWVGAGEWRKHLLNGPAEEWPAAWKSVERSKFLSHDGARAFKFEGLAPYGEVVTERWRKLAEAGFAPPIMSFGPESGYVSYEFVRGRCAKRADLSDELLLRMANYIAARAELFSVAGTESSDLATMARVNAQKGLGVELPEEFSLPVVRPAICDGRMMPHEWIMASGGRMLKLDAASHGDDHFFPGPCDIAWDIAGAIVEWGLDRRAGELLVSEYRHCSNDDPSERLPNYLLAYVLFRMGYCMMATNATEDRAEKGRLEQATSYYHEHAVNLINMHRDSTALAQISG